MANEAIQDPLAELKDIHLPPPPEFWPPAPGWWLLAALATLACAYLIYLGVKYWRKNAYRRYALAELEQIFAQYKGQDSIIMTETNELLKRVALTRYPRDKVANLTGESWVAFLDASANVHDFSMGPGQVLVDGPYANDNKQGQPVDEAALFAAAQVWIKKHGALA